MRQKQRLLVDPGVSTFFVHICRNSPVEVEEAAQNIGVEEQRARKWAEKLEEHDFVNIEFDNGRRQTVLTEENLEALEKLLDETVDGLTEDMKEWARRRDKSLQETDRLKDFVDEDDRDDYLQLKDSLQGLDVVHPGNVRVVVEAEEFLGHGRPEREVLHDFERKFKLLQRLSVV